MRILSLIALGLLMVGCATVPTSSNSWVTEPDPPLEPAPPEEVEPAVITLIEDAAGHLLRSQFLSVGASGKLRVNTFDLWGETWGTFGPLYSIKRNDVVDPTQVDALASELFHLCSALPRTVPVRSHVLLDAPFRTIDVFANGRKCRVQWYDHLETGVDTPEVKQFQAAWDLATQKLPWPPLSPPPKGE